VRVGGAAAADGVDEAVRVGNDAEDAVDVGAVFDDAARVAWPADGERVAVPAAAVEPPAAVLERAAGGGEPVLPAAPVERAAGDDPALAETPRDVAPGAPLTDESVVGALAVAPDAGAPSDAPEDSAGGAEAAADVSSVTTCVSDICGFFLESADIHQIAPATANTATTTNAGATNLLESGPAGALTMRVRSGCATLARLE
jgi:hypothetical protein